MYYPECSGFRGELRRNEPMSRHTSLKVGGIADIFAIPEDQEDLMNLAACLAQAAVPFVVVGGGYNLLVKDGGIRGAVVSLEKLDRILIQDNNCITAFAGAENITVVRFAQQRNLGGIGFISGVPGTVGGAVRVNAGAYGRCILDHVKSLDLIRNRDVLTIEHKQLDYGYRFLHLEPDDIIVSVTFALEETPAAITEEEIRQDAELRRSRHNTGFPSAGSFFKNPAGSAAWKLIDAAGMRGFSVGNAQMSVVHSNFMINRGNATASDCLLLASQVKNAVFESANILLEEEVRVVGEEP